MFPEFRLFKDIINKPYCYCYNLLYLFAVIVSVQPLVELHTVPIHNLTSVCPDVTIAAAIHRETYKA